MTDGKAKQVREILFGKDAITQEMKQRCYEEALAAYYSALGFEFASTDSCHENGIRATFHGGLGEPFSALPHNRRDWYLPFQKRFKPLTLDDGWDMEVGDGYRELIDTPKNQQMFEGLIHATFPHADVIEYGAKPNRSSSNTIRYMVFIPYADLEEMMADVLGITEKE